MNKRKYEDALSKLDKTFQSDDIVKVENSKLSKKLKMPIELENRINWFTLTHNLTNRKDKENNRYNANDDMFSFDSFLNRMKTYSLRTFPSKPLELSPPNLSLNGWSHDESYRNRIVCDYCQQGLVIDLSNSNNVKKLIDIYLNKLITEHLHKCPWKYQQLSKMTYKIRELSLPSNLALKTLIEKAKKIEINLNFDINLIHPLNQQQLNLLENLIPNNEKISIRSLILSLFGFEYKCKLSYNCHLLYSTLDIVTISITPNKTVDVMKEHRFYSPHLMPTTDSSKELGWQTLFNLITRKGSKKQQLEESLIINSFSRQQMLENVRAMLSGTRMS